MKVKQLLLVCFEPGLNRCSVYNETSNAYVFVDLKACVFISFSTQLIISLYEVNSGYSVWVEHVVTCCPC